MEIVSNVAGNTFRAVYAVRFREAVYVLHSFQKKSRRGIATPRAELETIRRRLRAAEQHYNAAYGKDGKSMSKGEDNRIERSSGNVFADLERPGAEEHLLKAELVSRISQTIRERRLTQANAAELLHLSQPDVSRLLRGDFREYSVERLFRLLNTLGRDVEIRIRRSPARRRGRLIINAA